jgi:hypothetical protein
MAKDFDVSSDISPDTGSDSSANADFGGDLASDNGMNLNAGNEGYGYGYEADPTEGSATNPFPVGNEFESNEFTAGYTDERHNLVNQLEGKDTDFGKRGLAKAAIMYVPPPVELPPPAEMVIEAPEYMTQTPMEQLQEKYPDYEFSMPTEEPQLDQSQTLDDLNESVEGIGQGIASLQEAKGEAEENGERINALQGPEYADNCDPPDSSQSEPVKLAEADTLSDDFDE